ncbi:unnamed protein product [Colias eurytheme]|nr:unnamed protein product [Colias eurytheme]
MFIAVFSVNEKRLNIINRTTVRGNIPKEKRGGDHKGQGILYPHGNKRGRPPTVENPSAKSRKREANHMPEITDHQRKCRNCHKMKTTSGQPIITLDFEKAPINAIKKTFPNIIVKGCFVHFGRALLRKAKSLGLLQHEESHYHVKLCMALAHLPKEDINDGWLYVMSQSFEEKAITEFNDYFVDQWLENEDMMNIWCCYAQRHRTTNLMESWNWSFNSEIGKRPSILLFFETISGNIKHYENLLKSFYNNGEIAKDKGGPKIQICKISESVIKIYTETGWSVALEAL